MHAHQLSLDHPVIRYVVRRDFISCCTIKARPTTCTDVQSIGEEHPRYTMTYILEKPVNTFTTDHFFYQLQSVKRWFNENRICY